MIQAIRWVADSDGIVRTAVAPGCNVRVEALGSAPADARIRVFQTQGRFSSLILRSIGLEATRHVAHLRWDPAATGRSTGIRSELWPADFIGDDPKGTTFTAWVGRKRSSPLHVVPKLFIDHETTEHVGGDIRAALPALVTANAGVGAFWEDKLRFRSSIDAPVDPEIEIRLLPLTDERIFGEFTEGLMRFSSDAVAAESSHGRLGQLGDFLASTSNGFESKTVFRTTIGEGQQSSVELTTVAPRQALPVVLATFQPETKKLIAFSEPSILLPHPTVNQLRDGAESRRTNQDALDRLLNGIVKNL